ncbi:hypothetical protein SVIOM342S_04399 [Streptomyces violaceorubidus]
MPLQGCVVWPWRGRWRPKPGLLATGFSRDNGYAVNAAPQAGGPAVATQANPYAQGTQGNPYAQPPGDPYAQNPYASRTFVGATAQAPATTGRMTMDDVVIRTACSASSW